MAILIDSSDRLLRTSDLLSYDADYTFMCWLYVVTAPGVSVYDTIFSINTSSNYDIFDIVGIGSNQFNLLIGTESAGDYTETQGATALAAATWRHVCIVRSANNSRIAYLDGVQELTHTSSVSGRPAPGRNEVGGFSSSNVDVINGRFDAIKIWAAALTAAEVQQELRVRRPVRLADLYGWWPCLPGSGERTRDYSGNGRNWTESGTVTDAAEAPVSWGAPIQLVGNPTGGGTTFTQSVGGTLTTAGALGQQAQARRAGTLSPSGALARQAQAARAGTLSSAGALTRQASQVQAGTLGSAGALATAKVAVLSLSGTLSTAGTLVRQAQAALGGALSPSGALVRQTQQRLGGTLTTAGALVRQTQQRLGGTLTTAGALAALKAAVLSVGGTLTTAGTLVRQAQAALGGALSPSGALVRQAQTALGDPLGSAGTLVRQAQTALGGTLTPAGTLGRLAQRTLAGTLATAGGLAAVLVAGGGPVLRAALTLSSRALAWLTGSSRATTDLTGSTRATTDLTGSDRPER